MTAPSPEQVEAIVAGLTRAQADAVCALDGNAWRRWPEWRLSAMLDGLGRHGLGELRVLGLARRDGAPWVLTALGRDVLAALQSKDQ